MSAERTAKDFELVGIFERFSKEADHAPATVKRWAPIIKAIAKEVPDIRDLTDIKGPCSLVGSSVDHIGAALPQTAPIS